MNEKQTSNFKRLRPKDKVVCKALKVYDNEAILDLNYVTEGTIYLNNFTLDKNVKSLKELLKEGDKVEAIIQKISERDDSVLILLSRIPLIKKEITDELFKLYKDKQNINVLVTKVLPIGLYAEYKSVTIFIPNYHVNFVHNDFKDLSKEELLNKEITVKLIEYDKKRNQFVASRRELIKEDYFNKLNEEKKEYQENKEKELNNINVNDVLEGTIEDVRNYGLLIKFNYNFGLARINELSHRHIDNINDEFKKGDKIEVKVIKKENNKLLLSRKALLLTDYEIFKKEHKIGETIEGEVVQKLPYGIVLKLNDYVTGLLHKSEYSWNPDDNFDAYVKIGSKVKVAILNIDVKKNKIALSKKKLEDNPWNRIDFKLGDIIEVTVTEIIPGKGLNVSTNGVDGFISINDCSVNKINKLEELYQVNDKLQAKVIELKPKEWILKLSIKLIEEEKQKAEFNKYLEQQEQEKQESKVTLGELFGDILKK